MMEVAGSDYRNAQAHAQRSHGDLTQQSFTIMTASRSSQVSAFLRYRYTFIYTPHCVNCTGDTRLQRTATELPFKFGSVRQLFLFSGKAASCPGECRSDPRVSSWVAHLSFRGIPQLL